MNFVESLNMIGVGAKEIPCIKGTDAPTTATKGAVGCFYMNTLNGDTYKCINVTDGKYIWEEVSTEGLKLKTIKDYVTPEMFGAKGDGKTDDTEAIQAAIDSDMPCMLNGTYLINNPIEVRKSHQIITINGKLIVQGSVGIIINGSYNKIDGVGKIEVASTECSAIRIVVEGSRFNYSNRIEVARIYTNHINNNVIGVEIVGSSTEGGQCFDRIKSDFRYLSKGIWSHKADGQNTSSWYTNLTIDCTFNGCIQACVDDWGGGSWFISGEVQPIVNITTIPDSLQNNPNIPLMKLYSHNRVSTYFWDMNTCVNTVGIQLCGDYNVMDTSLDSKYYQFVNSNKATQSIASNRQWLGFGCATATFWGENALSTFDNTNDVLLNCTSNPEVAFRNAYGDGDYNYYPISSGTVFDQLFNGDTQMSGAADIDVGQNKRRFKFEFAKAKGIRAIAVWGRNLAPKIDFNVRFVGTDEFKTVKTLYRGVDYLTDADVDKGQCAYWVFGGHNDTSGVSIYGKQIDGIEIIFYNDDNLQRWGQNMTRVSAFDCEPNITHRTGDTMSGDLSFASGTGVCLLSPNGDKYRLTVADDGTLSAAKV